MIKLIQVTTLEKGIKIRLGKKLTTATLFKDKVRASKNLKKIMFIPLWIDSPISILHIVYADMVINERKNSNDRVILCDDNINRCTVVVERFMISAAATSSTPSEHILRASGICST